MDSKPAKTRSWPKLLFKLTLAVLLALFTVPIFTVVQFNRHADDLIFYLKTGDIVRSKNELKQLHYFYDLSKKWRVQWLADKYLFRDAPFYGVADFYLIRNWDEVIRHLQDKLDDPRAYHYGNARFRDTQRKYQAGNLKEKQEALEFVVREVSQDYEKALRNCLDLEAEYVSCFDQIWNYDLTTNKRSAEEALRQPMNLPKFILGPLKDDVPGYSPDHKNKEPGGVKLDEKKPGAAGNQKRP